MTVATKNDWENLLDMPEESVTFILDRVFSPEEMRILHRGYIPYWMEEKWFLYMEGDTLFAHRSWTGFCIYKIEFSQDNHHKVTLNHNREQYGFSDDIEEERMLLNEQLDIWCKSHDALDDTAASCL